MEKILLLILCAFIIFMVVQIVVIIVVNLPKKPKTLNPPRDVQHLNKHRPQTIKEQLWWHSIKFSDGSRYSAFHVPYTGAGIDCIDDIAYFVGYYIGCFERNDEIAVSDILEVIKPHLWGSYIDIDENELRRLIITNLDYYASKDSIIYSADKSSFTMTIDVVLDIYTRNWPDYVEEAAKRVAKEPWNVVEHLPYQNFYENWFGDLSDEFDALYKEELQNVAHERTEKMNASSTTACSNVPQNIIDIAHVLQSKATLIKDQDVKAGIKEVIDAIVKYGENHDAKPTAISKSVFGNYMSMYVDAVDDYIALETVSDNNISFEKIRDKFVRNSKLLTQAIDDATKSANSDKEMLLSADLSALEALLSSNTQSLLLSQSCRQM